MKRWCWCSSCLLSSGYISVFITPTTWIFYLTSVLIGIAAASEFFSHELYCNIILYICFYIFVPAGRSDLRHWLLHFIVTFPVMWGGNSTNFYYDILENVVSSKQLKTHTLAFTSFKVYRHNNWAKVAQISLSDRISNTKYTKRSVLRQLETKIPISVSDLPNSVRLLLIIHVITNGYNKICYWNLCSVTEKHQILTFHKLKLANVFVCFKKKWQKQLFNYQ